MKIKVLLILTVVLAALVVVGIFLLTRPRGPGADAIAAAYGRGAPPLQTPVKVFHLGHSLVGPDMPEMLSQLAGDGHAYATQLGWGTSLREHFEPDLEIAGLETTATNSAYRDAREALASGDFDVLVLTEMVEIRDAIRYHDSADYLRAWEALARANNPEIRIFLYETWHRLDDPEGWLERLDIDLADAWETQVLLQGIDESFIEHPTWVIPGGQVMAHFVRKLEVAEGIGELHGREDLFARDADGARDPIHLNDLGAYLIALTHFAVIYQTSPIGLPAQLLRADGTPALAPSAEVARAMQESVWEVVTAYPKTGVRK